MHERDTTKKILPFGRWLSTLDTHAVATSSPRFAEPSIVDGQLYWLQSVPDEKGRTTIMHRPLEGQTSPGSLLPRPLSAKSKVHEYGGGSYLVIDNTLFFVLGDDQQIYRADLFTKAKFSPKCLTRHGPESARYADLSWDPQQNGLIAVCEDHNESFPEPQTRLVCVHLDGTVSTIASGADFYASPALSPCGTQLAWLCWNHPNMPWDATELWLATRDENGGFSQLNARKIAGNGNESLFLPRFHATGDLYFVSDLSDWWNLYKFDKQQLEVQQPQAIPILEKKAEFATPQWTFRMSTYHFLDENTLIACCSSKGQWQLFSIDLSPSDVKVAALNHRSRILTSFSDVVANAQGIGVCIAASAANTPDLYVTENKSPLHAVLQNKAALNQQDISVPQSVSFTTSNGDQAYGFYYAPQNANYEAQATRAPLIVICHGGPTGATDTAFNPKIQFWTNRGFAVMDVNYRGSTGFGRQYRQALHANWGIYDVADVCAAANFAVAQGWADPEKLIIKGSSAGGYTVLAALTFTNTFKAGVSLYGIGDLETLVRDTHKFEARYLDTLIGSYPQERDIYQQRSPIHRVENISCPLLVFQGLQDKVVPPNQAQAMVDAVRAKGLAVDYVTFEDEGHGFRNAENISTMLHAELAFYQKVFNL